MNNMRKVYIYQIGCGTFGKYGFEKLLQLSKKYDFVEFEGIVEINSERREFVKKKAEEYIAKLKIFDHTFEMYQNAFKLREKGNIFVYDAGPSELHYSHLLKSMKFGFWYLTEKPLALTKEEFEQELKLPKKWNCDFIEEENEAVLTAINYLKTNKLNINSIEIFRESSIGLQKILGNSIRIGVEGGCLLDKLCHEIYVFSFLNACGQKIKNIVLNKTKAEYLMIESLNKNNFLDIFGRVRNQITEEIATAQCIVEGIAKTGKEEIPFKLHSSWLGASEMGERISNKLKKLTNYEFVRKKQEERMEIPYEDLRLFVINCDTIVLYGDMKDKKLFVERYGKIEEIKLLKFKEDQLYRILERYVLVTAGKEKVKNMKNIKFIMNLIFDAEEKIQKNLRNKNKLREIRKTKNRVKEIINEFSITK